MGPASAARTAIASLLAAALVSCTPWRSDIELTRGVAAAPVLEVQGWQPPVHTTGPRRLAFGPWSAERRRGSEGGWFLTLLHDSTETGSAACRPVFGTDGGARDKGRRQEIPDEAMDCELAVAETGDTLRLELKADAGRPFAGRAQSADWTVTIRGTDRLRTRSCLLMPTCGWYLSMDGMDIAAVEADTKAWVFISPDLGNEVRDMAALLAATILLSADPSRFPGGPQQPMRPMPGPAHLTLPGPRAPS